MNVANLRRMGEWFQINVAILLNEFSKKTDTTSETKFPNFCEISPESSPNFLCIVLAGGKVFPFPMHANPKEQRNLNPTQLCRFSHHIAVVKAHDMSPPGLCLMRADISRDLDKSFLSFPMMSLLFKEKMAMHTHTQSAASESI